MRIVCRIKEQASETARCKNDISCKDRAHFAVFVLAHNTLANIVLFNKINHSGFWNYGYIFFFLCNVKKSICNFLACFILMMKYSVSSVSALTGVIVFAVFVRIKIDAKVNKSSDNLLRGFNHNTNGIGVIFPVTCFHCVLKITLEIINVLKHAHTALCEHRITFIGIFLCDNKNFLILWKAKCRKKTCYTASDYYNICFNVFLVLHKIIKERLLLSPKAHNDKFVKSKNSITFNYTYSNI